MKAFRFNLEALLRLRRSEADMVRQRLSEAMAKRSRCEESYQRCNERLDALAVQTGQRMEGKLHAGELARLSSLREQLREDLEEASRLLVEATRSEDTIREEWVDADRAAKVIEKLRERRLQEYRLEALRAQENEALDLYLSNTARALSAATDHE